MLNAFVEHRLGALLLLLEQLLGDEALGEEQARRHARHGEQVRLGAEEVGELARTRRSARLPSSDPL